MENRYDTAAREFYEALEEYNAGGRCVVRPGGAAAFEPAGARRGRLLAPRRGSRALGTRERKERGKRECTPSTAKTMRRARPDVLDRAHASGGVAPPRKITLERSRLRSGGPKVRQRDLREQRASRERANLKPGDIVRFGADPACSYVLRDHYSWDDAGRDNGGRSCR